MLISSILLARIIFLAALLLLLTEVEFFSEKLQADGPALN